MRTRRLRRASLGLCLGALVLGACMTELSDKERLATAVREFNEGVRWNRLDQAVNRIPPDARRRFLARRGGLEEALEINDLDVQEMTITPAGAEVYVDVRWSLKSRGILEQTVVAQSWRKHSGQWMVDKETRVRGAPLTLFDEPDRIRAGARDAGGGSLAEAPPL